MQFIVAVWQRPYLTQGSLNKQLSFSEIQIELANVPNFAAKFGKLVKFCKN